MTPLQLSRALEQGLEDVFGKQFRHHRVHGFATDLVASQVALVVKNPPANAGDTRDAGSPLGREDPLEEGTATHSSILAWRIPWTEQPGGLQSWGHKESDTTEVNQHATTAVQSRCGWSTGKWAPLFQQNFTDKMRRLAQGPVCQTLLEKIKETPLYLSRIFTLAPRTKKVCEVSGPL